MSAPELEKDPPPPCSQYRDAGYLLKLFIKPCILHIRINYISFDRFNDRNLQLKDSRGLKLIKTLEAFTM